MAITTSDGSGSHSPGDRAPFLDRDRRTSVSSFGPGHREEVSGIGRSPLGTSSTSQSGLRPPLTAPATGGLGLADDGMGTGGKITSRTISRGFSIGGFGKKRTASNASSISGVDKTQTAMDMLKQFEDKK